jgi:trypsin-like peptidase
MTKPADNSSNTQHQLVSYYKKILKTGESRGAGRESVEDPAEPDLSSGGIRDRLSFTRSELYRIVKDHLGDKPDLYSLADLITANAASALEVLRDEDEIKIRESADLLEGLEAIVRADGSRPSFLIRNAEVDQSTSPVGNWGDTLNASAGLLSDAVGCVGRIDVPDATQGFEGTGFLIHENLILTNRHVLQASADKQADGTWEFKPGIAIDFGHEFRARESINRRLLKRVVFCGSKPISERGPVDHARLDLALIELDPAELTAKPRLILAVDMAPDWAEPQKTIFIVGYPGNPGFSPYPPTLLERLFQSTFGYKRLAPGLVIRSQVSVSPWTVVHDATTLGGNSGSIVLVAGREHIAAGLHYGGRRDPSENWGHVLGLIMNQTDGQSPKSLQHHLEEFGVELIDRIGSRNN